MKKPKRLNDPAWQLWINWAEEVEERLEELQRELRTRK